MAYLLVHARDTESAKRGEIQHAKDQPIWGTAERLPNFVRVEVRGVSAEEVLRFSERWVTQLKYELVEETDALWRLLIQINPKVVKATGIDDAIDDALKAFIVGGNEGQFSVSQVSFDGVRLTVDIQKSPDVTLSGIRAAFDNFFNDVVAQTTRSRQFYLPASEMTMALAAGAALERAGENSEGKIDRGLQHHVMTKESFLARIRDRMDD